VDARLLAKVFADRKPMPSVGLVDRLRDLYEQDVARLEEDLGRDLSHWLKGR
jgi:hypothetical protein